MRVGVARPDAPSPPSSGTRRRACEPCSPPWLESNAPRSSTSAGPPLARGGEAPARAHPPSPPPPPAPGRAPNRRRSARWRAGPPPRSDPCLPLPGYRVTPRRPAPPRHPADACPVHHAHGQPGQQQRRERRCQAERRERPAASAKRTPSAPPNRVRQMPAIMNSAALISPCPTR